MYIENHRTSLEEFYGEPVPAPPHRTKLIVWGALIGACLVVWGFAIWLILHLI